MHRWLKAEMAAVFDVVELLETGMLAVP